MLSTTPIIADRLFQLESGAAGGATPIARFQFGDGNRWSSSSASGSGLTQGDPTTLTWGIVADGTNIPGLIGEPDGNSDLIAALDANIGSGSGGSNLTLRPWFSIFTSAFARLGELSGLTYVYEAADDGAAFSDVNSSPGQPGSRPDIRIGGHSIDGDSGTLGYSFFPDIADMVIDTDDMGFYSDDTDNHVAFRDVLMHESGHGVGIDHVESTNAAFLMEPFIDTSFDGPQLDDILALQRGYGDALEKGVGNNTSGTATDLGTVSGGATVRRGTLGSTTTVAATGTDFLSIDDESDVDFFQFMTTDAASVTLTLTPRGTTYNQGPEGSSQSSFNSAAQSNLSLQLLDTNGSTVLRTANVNGLGGAESIGNVFLNAGTYFAKVSGATTNKIQMYGLDVTAGDVSLGLSISDVSVIEGSNSAVFTVSLSTPNSQTVTVNYATADALAVVGSDYSATSGTLTFSPGQTSRTISVPILSDSRNEADENFFVNLTSATNSAIADSQGQGTITDNDPIPTLSINNVTVVEGTGNTQNAVFNVTLSAASGQTVTVDYATADGTATLAGSDYTATNGTLTFAPGQMTQTVTVAITGDAIYEASETYFVNLSGATNATIANGQGTGTINNNDPLPKVLIDDVVVTEGTGDAVFTISLATASGLPVTVRYSTVNSETTRSTAKTPEDFTATSGSVTFAAGETTKLITVPVVDDALDEPSQTFFVDLLSPTNGAIADNEGQCTILDDDAPPAISISDVTVTEGSGKTVNAVFTVSLSAPSGLPVTVSTATANGTAVTSGDYTPRKSVLQFAPGQTSKTITVLITGDVRDELDETLFLNLTNPSNATIADSQGQCTILDDDATPTLTIDNRTVTEGTGGKVNAIFTVSLSAASGLPVTVSYATADNSATAPADYTSVSGSLSFAAGQLKKTITVPVSGDALDELNETYFVNLSNSTNAPLVNSQGIGTITDNDGPPALSINNVSVTEGNVGTVDVVFTVKLTAASGLAVTVDFATANGAATAGSDYNSVTGSLTFNPGETTKTITVSILGDTVHELSKTFFINLSNPLNALFADSQGVGTILDND